MSPTDAPAIVVADPTLFIAISWIASALVLGGLAVHAVLEARSSGN